MSVAVLVEPDLTGDESLAERAYRGIRRLIVTLELPPGAVISEPDLQERIGVGRTPVREALHRLWPTSTWSRSIRAAGCSSPRWIPGT